MNTSPSFLSFLLKMIKIEMAYYYFYLSFSSSNKSFCCSKVNMQTTEINSRASKTRSFQIYIESVIFFQIAIAGGIERCRSQYKKELIYIFSTKLSIHLHFSNNLIYIIYITFFHILFYSSYCFYRSIWVYKITCSNRHSRCSC